MSNKSSLHHRRRLQLWRLLQRGNLMSWDNSFIRIQVQGSQMRVRSRFRKAKWLHPLNRWAMDRSAVSWQRSPIRPCIVGGGHLCSSAWCWVAIMPVGAF